MKIFVVFAVYIVATTVAVPLDRSPVISLRDFLSYTKVSENRIIDGTPAREGQFPWQVAIYMRHSGGTSFCGGSLISDQWVLTAAHCVQGFIDFTLYLGAVTLDEQENGRVTITTSTSIAHSGYTSDYLNNDIALIRIETPITFTDRIQPIRLASRGSSVGAGVPVVVSGWGKTSDESNSVSNSLNWVELTTIDNMRCSSVYGPLVVVSSTLCALGNPHHSTCNGDSGGPLITYDMNGEAVHQGVVSFVHSNGCASGNPSGYVRTTAMLDWIAANTGLDI